VNSTIKFIKTQYAFLLLSSIFILSLVLNLVNLSSNPVSLNQDEAVNGYDAYSLGTTLRDHHGNFLPPMLESFEDWASPLLTYFTIPFVKLLGLSEFSIRLPVALLGSLSVLLIFLFIWQLFGKVRLSLITAFLYAIIPWQITLSRWAIPPSIVPFFLLLTLTIFMWANKNNKVYNFIGVGVAAGILTYSYPTQKVFVPMLLAGFLLIDLLGKVSWKELFGKALFIGIPYLILVSPIYYLTITNPPKYNARFSYVSIFALPANLLQEILARYLQYFSPYFQFGTGDPDMMHHIPGSGTSYAFLAIFYYLGIIVCLWTLFRKDVILFLNRKSAVILIIWLVIFPIPASLTIDHYHVLRVVHGLPLTIIFSAIGIMVVFNYLKAKSLQYLSVALFLVLSFGSLALFSKDYYWDYQELAKESFQYGIPTFYTYLLNNEDKFTSVKIDSKINMPYIYYLFESKFDPNKLDYREINATVKNNDWSGVPKIGKYQFEAIDIKGLDGAKEIYRIEDSKLWYVIYAKGAEWFVMKGH